MSIWVRLIGGPSNGKVEKIEHEQTVIVSRTSAPAPMVASHRNFGLSSASVDEKVAIYTRRMVCTPGGDINFFAPEGLSDFEALQSVLGP